MQLREPNISGEGLLIDSFRPEENTTMIIITIGSSSTNISNKNEIDESWINQQINRRRHDRLSVCVTVTIKFDDIYVLLQTPGCNPMPTNPRPPKPREKEIINLWYARGLNKADFNGGNLIAFLKQLFLNG